MNFREPDFSKLSALDNSEPDDNLDSDDDDDWC